MIEHVMAPLLAVCRQVVIVGDCAGYPIPDGFGVGCIRDLHPGSGPLAGIEALLTSRLDTGYLVAACDQPFLTPALLERLVAGDPARPRFFRAEDGRRLDPFPGYFPASLLPLVEEVVRAGELSVRDLITRSQASWAAVAKEDEECLRSLDTPADVERYAAPAMPRGVR
jgi:molybdopterin-guanine dinucleotide biosynthesis protein A